MKGNLESKRLNAHFKMQTASNGFKLSPFKQFKSHVKHIGLIFSKLRYTNWRKLSKNRKWTKKLLNIKFILVSSKLILDQFQHGGVWSSKVCELQCYQQGTWDDERSERTGSQGRFILMSITLTLWDESSRSVVVCID